MKHTLVNGKRYRQLLKIPVSSFYRFLDEERLEIWTIEGQQRRYFDPAIKPIQPHVKKRRVNQTRYREIFEEPTEAQGYPTMGVARFTKHSKRLRGSQPRKSG